MKLNDGERPLVDYARRLSLAHTGAERLQSTRAGKRQSQQLLGGNYPEPSCFWPPMIQRLNALDFGKLDSGKEEGGLGRGPMMEIFISGNIHHTSWRRFYNISARDCNGAMGTRPTRTDIGISEAHAFTIHKAIYYHIDSKNYRWKVWLRGKMANGSPPTKQTQ